MGPVLGVLSPGQRYLWGLGPRSHTSQTPQQSGALLGKVPTPAWRQKGREAGQGAEVSWTENWDS